MAPNDRKRSMRSMSDDNSGTRRAGSAARNTPSNRARSRAVSRKKVAPVRYRAVFDHDEGGAWLASIPRIRGCHTYGRTLDQARRRLREALSLWIDDVDAIELVEEVRLPARASNAIRASKQDRAHAGATRN